MWKSSNPLRRKSKRKSKIGRRSMSAKGTRPLRGLKRKSKRKVKVKRRSVRKRQRRSRKSRSFGNNSPYQDPMFGFNAASTQLGVLTPYYEYNRIAFPSPGGIRQEVGTGWKNIPIPMGKKVSGPFYSAYNV
jgi:hypothetical protein